jgi:DNA-binding protein YbaB
MPDPNIDQAVSNAMRYAMQQHKAAKIVLTLVLGKVKWVHLPPEIVDDDGLWNAALVMAGYNDASNETRKLTKQLLEELKDLHNRIRKMQRMLEKKGS